MNMKRSGRFYLHRANGPWEFAEYKVWKSNGKLDKTNRRTMSKNSRNLIKRLTKTEIAMSMSN